MIPSDKRPPGMSQLDWLWATYKDYNVTDSLPSEASSSLLLTDRVIRSLISDASSGNISTLLLVDNPNDESLVELVGYNSDGTVVTVVEMPKEDHVEAIGVRNVTKADGDCGYDIGTKVLYLNTRLGKTYMVSCAELAAGLISTDKDNLITEGSDGGLFASVEWIYV